MGLVEKYGAVSGRQTAGNACYLNFLQLFQLIGTQFWAENTSHPVKSTSDLLGKVSVHIVSFGGFNSSPFRNGLRICIAGISTATFRCVVLGRGDRWSVTVRFEITFCIIRLRVTSSFQVTRSIASARADLPRTWPFSCCSAFDEWGCILDKCASFVLNRTFGKRMTVASCIIHSLLKWVFGESLPRRIQTMRLCVYDLW